MLSLDLRERIENAQRELNLSGLALAGSVDGLVELFGTRDIAHLNLSDCLLSTKPAAQLLAALNGVNTLELKGNDLRGNSVAVLAQLVRRCELLHSLNLEWNALGHTEQEFGELMSSIGAHRTMHDVDLRNNQLQCGHGQIVAQMLSTNPTLKRIDLRWNRIGATAGREILDALKHNTTIESVLLDGNGLTADLVDSIRLIADRNSVAHQIHQKSQAQTSFLLDELEQTKSVALQESTRFNSEREITHHQRVELEANLWANKNVLIELRGKLEIAEATVAERKAQVDDMHHELEEFKRDARETQSMLQVELDKVRLQTQQKTNADEAQLAAQRTRILELESVTQDAQREIESYRAQVDNMNKNFNKERQAAQDTKQTEERHQQRNMNRLNEEIERERQFRKLQEDEVVKMREQLAETMRSFKIMEDKYQNELKTTEHSLNHRKDEMVRELQARLDQEKDAHAIAERNNHAMRLLTDDLKAQVTSAEESRDRLHQAHRDLELAVDPTRRELEHVRHQLLQMKEERVAEIAEARSKLQAKSDELVRASAELGAFKEHQKQKEDFLRGAIQQYFH